MIRLLRWLIWGDGHLHKWELRSTVNGWGGNEYPSAIFKSCQCSVCGEYRSFRI